MTSGAGGKRLASCLANIVNPVTYVSPERAGAARLGPLRCGDNHLPHQLKAQRTQMSGRSERLPKIRGDALGLIGSRCVAVTGQARGNISEGGQKGKEGILRINAANRVLQKISTVYLWIGWEDRKSPKDPVVARSLTRFWASSRPPKPRRKQKRQSLSPCRPVALSPPPINAGTFP